MPRWPVWTIGAVGLLSVAAIAWVFLSPSSDAPVEQTRTDGGQNGVEFIATYNGTEGDVSAFYVKIETHSVDLAAFDPMESVLVQHGADRLPATASSRVESRSSHHIAALLFFETGPTHDELRLIAQDLAGIRERTLVFSA